MMPLLQDRTRIPVALRNLSAARTWRPSDMLNWHRLVSPLRNLASDESSLTLYQVLFDMCTTFEVTYEPMPAVPRGAAQPETPACPRVGLFVDAPDHTSGVATTLRSWNAEAARAGAGLRIHYCGAEGLFPNSVCFRPEGRVTLGVYQGLQLCMPSVLEVFRAFQAAPPEVVHLSTPGPMGLLGLIAARRAGVPVVGTYHTDFPSYAANLTGDPQMEMTSWRFMRWFYGQMDRVAAPSTDIRAKLIRQGIPPERVSVVGRGVNTGAFSPSHRDPALRESWGPGIRHWLLYVGRVSREKNLPCLAEAYRQIAAHRKDIGLVVVGEGPYLEDLRRDLAGLPVVFAGLQRGEALARHYASADLFVFPSLTDTFGVVLLEAQASGLPVLVSAEGGPKDCVVDGVTGHIVEPMNPTLLSRRIESALADDLERLRMGDEARRWAVQQTPARSFEAFWDLHTEHLRPADAVAPNAGGD